MKRVLTALFLVPLGVYSALFAPWWILFGVIAAVACLCFIEYSRIAGAFAPLGLAAGLLLLLAQPGQVMLIVVFTALAAMCLPLNARNLELAVPRSAALVLGVLYIFGAWKCGILVHDTGPAGRWWLMFALMVNWIGDTGAYYVGRRYGRRKLAPAVSPGKTWEGAFASSITGIIFGVIYLPLTIPGTSLLKAALFSFAANAAGQIGDLAESAIKRGAGVKDSGSMLPGHGGVLDRVDSTMFALPVVYGMLMLF